jgi:hypothetical protein
VHQFSSVAHQLSPIPERRFRVFATCHIGEPAENLLREKGYKALKERWIAGAALDVRASRALPHFT